MKPEILAPAGSMEALKAAVHAGADAVYLGGTRFGARAYAGNFDEAALIEGIEYSHLQGVKVYLTVNTLFRNEELSLLADYLKPYYEAGLDAVIVQDFGAMRYIHAHFPELSIHASTQMTITTGHAYSLLAPYGVTRIVPARELTLPEIARLKSEAFVPEVEVFVQGALCYCYSGQCLMSSMIGGRSGNRGRCAQTCRLPYTVYDREGKKIRGKGEYVLSPKDLCGLSAVPELIQAGVDSFKIEGRMKKPEYVAVCTRAYRRAVDACEAGSFSEEMVRQLRMEMAEVFNRGGFTQGYFKGKQQMMSVREPGNAGVSIGKIEQLQKNRIGIRLNETVYQGDILMLRAGKEQVTLTSPVRQEKGALLKLNASRVRDLKVGQKISRMLSKPLDQELGRMVSEERPIPIRGRIELRKGQDAVLELSADIRNRHFSVRHTGEQVTEAQSRALDQQTVEDKVGRLGDAGFVFERLEIELQEGVFYPLGALKELRREGLYRLRESILSADRRLQPGFKEREEGSEKMAGRKTMRNEPEHVGTERDEANNDIESLSKQQQPDVRSECDGEPDQTGNGLELQSVAHSCANRQQRQNVHRIHVMVSSKEQYELVRHVDWIDAVYLDLQFFSVKEAAAILQERRDLVVALPSVMRDRSASETEEICRLIGEQYAGAGVLVRNLDELAFLKEIGYHGRLIADYSLYMMNRESLEFLGRVFPQAVFTYPVELNRRQLAGLAQDAAQTGQTGELIVYGHQPLMVSAQCLSSTLGKCDHGSGRYVLKDRYQKEFYTQNVCKYCYSLIYNGLPTMLYDLAGAVFDEGTVFRLHFTREDARQTQLVLEAFQAGKLPELEKTRGHFNRGVE